MTKIYFIYFFYLINMWEHKCFFYFFENHKIFSLFFISTWYWLLYDSLCHYSTCPSINLFKFIYCFLLLLLTKTKSFNQFNFTFIGLTTKFLFHFYHKMELGVQCAFKNYITLLFSNKNSFQGVDDATLPANVWQFSHQ